MIYQIQETFFYRVLMRVPPFILKVSTKVERFHTKPKKWVCAQLELLTGIHGYEAQQEVQFSHFLQLHPLGRNSHLPFFLTFSGHPRKPLIGI